MVRVAWSILLVWFCSAFIAGAAAVSLEEVPNPRPFSAVSDRAGRITIEATEAIDSLVGDLKAQGRGEIAVAVVLGIDGQDPRRFATELFNRWGIGEAAKNNGVLVFVALDDRAAEIILGDGVDSPRNVRHAQEIMREVMVPNLRRGDVSEAVLEASRAIAQRVLPAPPPAAATPPAVAPLLMDALPAVEAEDEIAPELPAAAPPIVLPQPPAARPVTPPAIPTPAPSVSVRPSWRFLVVLAPLGVLGVVAAALFRLFRAMGRPPACPLCGQPMQMLGEIADDEFLTEGQRLEEQLGSVDHRVWYCERDSHVEHTASSKWFTRFSGCPSCGHRTLSSTSTVLQPATYSSQGLMRIDETCAHCGAAATSTRIIPQKQREDTARALGAGIAIGGSRGSGRSSFSSFSSSSRSGSRSGGFGGGRSSGRGASGRW